MEHKIKLTLEDNKIIEVNHNTVIKDVVNRYVKSNDNPILGAKLNNNLVNLNDKFTKDAKLELIDLHDINGYKMYQAGLKFVIIIAARELWGTSVKLEFLNSLDTGTYTKIPLKEKLTKTDLDMLSNKMKEIIAADLPIKKISADKKEAIDYFHKIEEPEKGFNIRSVANKTATLYKLKDSYNYFYTEMPASTGVLTKFELNTFDDPDGGFILSYPKREVKNGIEKYTHYPKILESFEEYRSWLNMVGVKYVADLNEIVSKSEIKEFILTNALIKNESMMQLASDIIDNKTPIKIILIAGPSSSGKTTSANKIKLFLKSFGINSVMLSTDDYFKEREETPKDHEGNYEYEVVEALDLELLQSDLEKLCNYEEINPPKYNFFTGKKEFGENKLKIRKGDIIIMEGLHCLNDELSSNIPRENKYKVYVSPFTALNLDRHNHISTIDLRLLRRLVRDNMFRGRSVEETLESWQKVREGEIELIFPYQGEADSILNTALIYELGVLKVFAEPILYSVPSTSQYYEEAKRLLSFLRPFFPISSELVENDSVLREFIGGSIFY